MTRLSDDAWRAKMEGKPIVGKDPLPLFDAAPPPPPETKPNPLAERIADAMVDGYVQTGNPADAVRAGLSAIVEHVVSEAVSSPTFRNEARDAIDRAEKAGTITPEAADLGRLVVSTSPPAKPPESRPPTVAIVCSRGRGGGCRRVELPNDEAADPWARARSGKAPTPVERGTAGSEAAGSKWTKAEKQAIDSAIGILAAAEIPFTSDEVWALAPGVPVSKGIGARLRLAARRGLIRNTGEHRTSTRGGKHDHAQTLTVWIGGNP